MVTMLRTMINNLITITELIVVHEQIPIYKGIFELTINEQIILQECTEVAN